MDTAGSDLYNYLKTLRKYDQFDQISALRLRFRDQNEAFSIHLIGYFYFVDFGVEIGKLGQFQASSFGQFV